jgi:serine/threonine protein kinase/tetratricopeptide (TPR) repeat protein
MDTPLGTLIGNRYQLTRSLEAGGMGQVFEAEDIHLFNRRVAIKLLHQNLIGSEQLRRRFQAEARISALLGEHPLIVRVTDYGLHYDQPYIVMEFLGAAPIVGEPLNKLLSREGRLEVKRAIALGKKMCAALEFAHSFESQQADFSMRGVIHRDIKPSNIFILRDKTMGETIKLLDFGIAKTVSDVNMAMGTHMGFIGTPGYASPEQLRGEPLDYRSDIYSLGIVLYEMLSGEQPLVPKTESFPGWYEAQNFQMPKPLNPLLVPEDIATVVMSCLEKDPQRRPASMAVLKDQLSAGLKQVSSRLKTTGSSRSSAKHLDPNLRLVLDPLASELSGYQVNPQFRLKGEDLHILLEYSPEIQPDRGAVLQVIMNFFEEGGSIPCEQVLVYGRRYQQTKPDWQESFPIRSSSLKVTVTQPKLPFEEAVTSADTIITQAPQTNATNAIEDPKPTTSIRQRLTRLETLAGESKTQFHRLQRRAYLISLPDLSHVKAEVKRWARENLTFIEQTTYFLERKRSILDIPPGAMLAYQAGVDALQQGDLAQAAQNFSSALQQDPLLVEARVYLGNILIRQGQRQAGIWELESALRMDPNLPEAYTYLGGAFLQEGKLDRAIPALQAALQQKPDLAEAQVGLLKALLQTENISAARERGLEAFQQSPQLIAIRVELAQIVLLYAQTLLQQGETEDALFFLRKAISLNADDALLHCYLGLTLVSGKKKTEWQEASTEFRITLRLNNQIAEAHLGMGLATSKVDNLKAAIGYYQTALDLDPGLIPARYNLATALFRQGELHLAVQEYQKVLEEDPNYAEGYVSLAQALFYAGNHQEALGLLNIALGLVPELAEAFCVKGNILAHLGELTEATRCYRHALDLYPLLGSAQAGIGLIYLAQNGDLDSAKAKFELALKTDSSLPEAYLGLAEVSWRQDSYGQAIKQFRTALQNCRSYTLAHYRLGLLLASQKNLEEAITELRLVLQLDPNYPEAQDQLTQWEAMRSSK